MHTEGPRRGSLRSSEPIVGWIGWMLRSREDGRFVLASMARGTPVWTPGKPIEAECRLGQDAQAPSHKAPAEGCHCGERGHRSIKELVEDEQRSWGWRRVFSKPGWAPVVGTAQLWGRVIEDRRGCRAQFAAPRDLRVRCWFCADVQPRWSASGPRPVPLCDGHWADRRAPWSTIPFVNAREVERQLCSDYGVERCSVSPFATGEPGEQLLLPTEPSR